MNNKKISASKRIILVPLALIAMFTIIGIGLTYWYFYELYYDRYEKDLIRLARSGSQLLIFSEDGLGIADYDRFANTFAGNGHFKVTIIDINGVVLGDSELSIEEVRQTESYKGLPEILQARELGVGVSKRFSKLLKDKLFYVAIHYDSLHSEGYLRIAYPMKELKIEKRNQLYIFGGFCLAMLMAATIISLLASRYLILITNREKGYLEERVRDRTKQLETLMNLGSQFAVCNDRDEVLDVIRNVSSMLLPEVAGALAITRSSRDKVEVVETWNGDWQGETMYAPNECWALRTGQPYIGNPEVGKIVCGHSPDLKGRLLCIPLVAQGETHGVLHFFCKTDAEWTTEKHKLACTLAERTGFALANLQLRESLSQQATHDPLTGLHNRRFLFETADRELNRAARRNQRLGLLMMDLDHFKSFNDEHGHDVGDFILSEFGRLLRIITRGEDVSYRYGGEEFVVLIPEADDKAVLEVAERIRTKVREHNFLFKNQTYGPITISIGVAIFPENGDAVELLIKHADNALYNAKKTGRDRVCLLKNQSSAT